MILESPASIDRFQHISATLKYLSYPTILSFGNKLNVPRWFQESGRSFWRNERKILDSVLGIHALVISILYICSTYCEKFKVNFKNIVKGKLKLFKYTGHNKKVFAYNCTLKL